MFERGNDVCGLHRSSRACLQFSESKKSHLTTTSKTGTRTSHAHPLYNDLESCLHPHWQRLCATSILLAPFSPYYHGFGAERPWQVDVNHGPWLARHVKAVEDNTRCPAPGLRRTRRELRSWVSAHLLPSLLAGRWLGMVCTRERACSSACSCHRGGGAEEWE